MISSSSPGLLESVPDLTRLEPFLETVRARRFDLVGHTTLGKLAAVVAGAQLVVCNDTGLSHMACPVGTPSAVISAGADAIRWRPSMRCAIAICGIPRRADHAHLMSARPAWALIRW